MTSRVHCGSCVVGWAALVVLCACEAHGLVGSYVSAEGGEPDPLPSDEDVDSGEPGSGDSTGGTTGADSSSGTTGEPVEETAHGIAFDVPVADGPKVCLAPQSVECDQISDSPWHAMGVNCPGTADFEVSFSGDPEAIVAHEGLLGTHGTFSPREGKRMTILSSGRASDIPRTHAQLGCASPLMCPSTAFGLGGGMSTLPPPLDVKNVSDEVTCTEDPDLVGTGDCSNSLQDEWTHGEMAHDYAEMRLRATVPPHTDGFAYEFAFFSAEYPERSNGKLSRNDIYVAWLESEAWTGNISFDQQGNPISTGGVFLDYREDSPELAGFAMEGHGGTRWLETVAPVIPGEEIEVVFAIFDLADGHLDTAVLLDNVHWSCTDLPPITQPHAQG